jgi:hypothetical protein
VLPRLRPVRATPALGRRLVARPLQVLASEAVSCLYLVKRRGETLGATGHCLVWPLLTRQPFVRCPPWALHIPFGSGLLWKGDQVYSTIGRAADLQILVNQEAREALGEFRTTNQGAPHWGRRSEAVRCSLTTGGDGSDSGFAASRRVARPGSWSSRPSFLGQGGSNGPTTGGDTAPGDHHHRG